MRRFIGAPQSYCDAKYWNIKDFFVQVSSGYGGDGMTKPIRSTDIEKSVRAVIQGGAQIYRVTVDLGEGKILIDTMPGEGQKPSFDNLDFRREAR